MKDSTKNWVLLADKELKVAECTLQASEPLAVIYHLHASVEKLLKGIHEENIGLPPRIHSLKKLAIDSCRIELKQKEQNLFDMLDKAFIDSRYPEDVAMFENKYSIESCKKLIQEVKEASKWLKSLLKNN